MPKRRELTESCGSCADVRGAGDETAAGSGSSVSGERAGSISALAESFQVTRQAVTKHLQFLAAAGIIDGKRAGREHVWTLNASRLDEAQPLS